MLSLDQAFASPQRIGVEHAYDSSATVAILSMDNADEARGAYGMRRLW